LFLVLRDAVAAAAAKQGNSCNGFVVERERETEREIALVAVVVVQLGFCGI
jgi:hypothetical protein